MRRALVLSLLPLALAGCGATPSSAGDFEGEEQRVAETVEDVQSAARSDETDRLCDELFARALARQLQAGSGNCRQEVATALDEGEAVELTVKDVSIQGSSARARVEGENGVRTLTLVREGGRWRVSELG
jgi:hypothetical protein